MNRILLIAICLNGLLGCGGVQSEGDPAQSGGGGTTQTSSTVPGVGGSTSPRGGSGGTTATMSRACQVSSGAGVALPQPLTFQIAFTGAVGPYYLVSQCAQKVRVYSCADNYVAEVPYYDGCPVADCDVPGSTGAACGACDVQPVELSSGTTVKVGFDGDTRAYQSLRNCATTALLPAGKYRALLDVYSTAEAALAAVTPSHTVSVDFDYPDDDGVVSLLVVGSAL